LILPCLLLFSVGGHAQTSSASAQREAVIVSKQALDFYNQGKFGIAAELYQKAYRIDSTRASYLYGAARALHKAGRHDEAISTYEGVVRQSKKGSRYHDKASKHLVALRAAARSSSGSMTGRMLAGWTGLGLGAIAAGGGVLSVIDGHGRNDALDTTLAAYSAGKPVPVNTMTYAQALDRRSEANSVITRGWLLVGGGAVIATAGIWLLATDDAKVALLPHGRRLGLRLVARF
jgi:tetratricopeptide (TPR) repeat protein